jgi:hypothetical protein
MTCTVTHCPDEASGVFDASPPGGPLLEFGVCTFHRQALEEGAEWTEVDGKLDLRHDRLLNWSVTQTLGTPAVRLTIGDSFESRYVEFTAEVEKLKDLVEILAHFTSGSAEE